MALANRRAVMEPASQRFRRTATVSTSTKSGAATSSARLNSERARSPSSPSSPMTLAMTDASMTINGVTAHRRCLRPPVPFAESLIGDVSAPIPTLVSRNHSEGWNQKTIDEGFCTRLRPLRVLPAVTRESASRTTLKERPQAISTPRGTRDSCTSNR